LGLFDPIGTQSNFMKLSEHTLSSWGTNDQERLLRNYIPPLHNTFMRGGCNFIISYHKYLWHLLPGWHLVPWGFVNGNGCIPTMDGLQYNTNFTDNVS